MISKSTNLILQNIETKIIALHGQKVILDVDLAQLYQVKTSRLNEQIKRNKNRFPEDFMFQLTQEDVDMLRSQFAISKSKRGGRRYLPYVFTEYGVLMAANVLNSERAIAVSIFIVRAFARLRSLVANNKELVIKLTELERKFTIHDKAIKDLFEAIRKLMSQPESPRRPIGFTAKI